jgi:hypothetical protein
MSSGSVVSTATARGLDDWEESEFESRYGQEFSLLHSVQTGSGVHPAFYPTCTKGSFPWGKGQLYLVFTVSSWHRQNVKITLHCAQSRCTTCTSRVVSCDTEGMQWEHTCSWVKGVRYLRGTWSGVDPPWKGSSVTRAHYCYCCW